MCTISHLIRIQGRSGIPYHTTPDILRQLRSTRLRSVSTDSIATASNHDDDTGGGTVTTRPTSPAHNTVSFSKGFTNELTELLNNFAHSDKVSVDERSACLTLVSKLKLIESVQTRHQGSDIAYHATAPKQPSPGSFSIGTGKTDFRTGGGKTDIGLSYKHWKIEEIPFYSRNLISDEDAVKEYLISERDLAALKVVKRRSPYRSADTLLTYSEEDVKKLAFKKFGGEENWKRHKSLQYQREAAQRLKDEKAQDRRVTEIQEVFLRRSMAGETQSVVVWAVMVNVANVVFKTIAYIITRSPSMLSEALHSLADTVNQLLLFAGIRQSKRKPSLDHPYGFAQTVYITSLLSAVSTFGIGGGCSVMAGITSYAAGSTLLDATPMGWAYSSLAFGLVTEGVVLWKALRNMAGEAALCKMGMWQYFMSNTNPSCNLVILEDLGAVLGNSIAMSAISLGAAADCFGSVLIGSGLCVASLYLIAKNFKMLIPFSIPESQKECIKQTLQGDPIIRGVYDVKATDIGNGLVRFKAEVDLDPHVLVSWYMETLDENLLAELHGLSTDEELGLFLQRLMEPLIDELGGHFDRVEHTVKTKHPEVRHVDLEPL